jgi:hypothetical protein
MEVEVHIFINSPTDASGLLNVILWLINLLEKKASDLYFMRMGENHSLFGWCRNKKQHNQQ